MPIQDHRQGRPRIGIPYRKLTEQLRGAGEKYDTYVRSVENAGGAPVPVALTLSSDDLEKRAEELDAIVLPGSPADVDPLRYGSAQGAHTAAADSAREATDLSLLRHCFDQGKPVLAICYGMQILNVYLGGSLIQDIPSEMQTSSEHAAGTGEPERFHDVTLEGASRLASFAQNRKQRVNSSHHQAIREPGRGLRVAARADDSVIEAVEWGGDSNWVTGVQWHPERMTKDDQFARRLFEDLVASARNAAVCR